MNLNYDKLKELLNGYGLYYQRHNDKVNFYDLEKGSLYPHKYQYDKAPFNKNGIEIDSTFDNVFNGENIDLLLSGKPYKRYMINIKNETKDFEDTYTFNAFESFEVLATGDYRKANIKFSDNKTEIYETVGVIDKYSNFVTNNIYKIIIKDNSVSIIDKTDPRNENDTFSFTYNMDNNEIKITNNSEEVKDYIEIINNSKYIKNTLKTLYPNLDNSLMFLDSLHDTLAK